MHELLLLLNDDEENRKQGRLSLGGGYQIQMHELNDANVFLFL